jgi:hypothetical protein
VIKDIKQLPSRYEPLVRTLGDKAETTFFEQPPDLEAIKTLVAQMQSAN